MLPIFFLNLDSSPVWHVCNSYKDILLYLHVPAQSRGLNSFSKDGSLGHTLDQRVRET